VNFICFASFLQERSGERENW